MLCGYIRHSLVQFSHSVMSDSLQPQGLQHAMFLWPSLFPEAYANSRPLSQWCHLVLSCPLLLLPSVFPRIRVFSNKSVLHIRWPKYWSFSFSISPSDEYSGLIYFRIDWFDLAVQGTLRSLLQYHSSMASILWCSAFSYCPALASVHDYGKTIALTIQTFDT